MTDMSCSLGGVRLPKPKIFARKDQGNFVTNTTLGNNIYTDFTGISRTWTVGWENMLYADYQTVRDLYFRQNLNGYLYFTFNAYNIYTPVLLEISEAQLSLNGVLIPSFTITLREQSATS